MKELISRSGQWIQGGPGVKPSSGPTQQQPQQPSGQQQWTLQPMMGVSVASSPMGSVMQPNQMAFWPMASPMAPMTGMTAPYNAAQPMNVNRLLI